MTLIINGEQRDVANGTTLADVSDLLSVQGSGVAIAVNNTVVPHSEWSTATLQDGDRVEVLTAVGGG